MDWWICEKHRSDVVDQRDNCWYGKNCRTQNHNPDHAARLSHSCHETPAAERVNRHPRRISVPPVASEPQQPQVQLQVPQIQLPHAEAQAQAQELPEAVSVAPPIPAVSVVAQEDDA